MIAKVSVEIDGNGPTYGTVTLHVEATGDKTTLVMKVPRGGEIARAVEIATSDLVSLGHMLSALSGRKGDPEGAT